MGQNSVQALKSRYRNKSYRLGTSENFTFDPLIHDGITLILPTSYSGTLANTAMADGQSMRIIITTEADPKSWFDVPALGTGDYEVSGEIFIQNIDGTLYGNFNAMSVIDSDFSDLETYMTSIAMLYANRVNISAIVASKATLVYTPKVQVLTNKTVSGGTIKNTTMLFKSGTPVNAVNASYRTAFAAASANLIYTAKVAGATTGSAIMLRYVGGSPSSALAVTVPEANYIRVKLQTNAVSAASCTASQIKAAIKAAAAASALVGTPALVSGVGEDIVSSMASHAHLAGGVNGTLGTASQILFDSTNIYGCTGAQTVSGKSWKKIAWTSL